MRPLADDFIPRSVRQWDQVRAQLLADADWLCTYCDTPLTWKSSHIDHAIPRCQGGTNHLANLHISCAPCNLRKGGRNVPEWSDSVGWLAGDYG